MKKLGLIGYPLSHSFSKPFFEEKFIKLGLKEFSFDVFELKHIKELPDLLQKEKNLVGLSVTIPHKQTVMQYLTEVDNTASEIGAVNCIKISDGKRKGYNTDAVGFRQSLRPFLDLHHTKALVFGTGGASKAVAYVLKNLGIDYWFVSRRKDAERANLLTYEEVTPDVIKACKLLVNCTPVGTWPNDTEFLPIPYEAITPRHFAYDLVYNPSDTVFLSKAKQRGALISNGYNMLVFQAEEAWRIWNE